MKRQMFFSLTLIVLLIGLPAYAQKDEPLNRFVGDWRGDGKFFGMNATAKAKWEWTLGGKFLRLSISYEMKMADGKTQVFEGVGYYQSKGVGKYEGRWFDSQGNAYPITGALENGTLTSMWGEVGNYNGKSVYKFNETAMEVADASKQKDGSWKEFSSFKLIANRQ